MGIFLALCAMVGWVIGDFYIQRATKKVGDWKTLFYIGLVGFVMIGPFVGAEIKEIFQNSEHLLLLSLVSVITLVAALFLFEGLKRGKISVIEPIFGMELLFTVGFSVVLGGEHLSAITAILIGVAFIGLLLVVTKNHKDLHLHKTILEKGVIYAAIGSVGMGIMNYLTGVGSQTISPLATIWFIHTFLAISCLVYLLLKRQGKSIITDFVKNPAIILTESIADNFAWVCYAASMVLIPISIATTISESYIAFLVILGVVINKEKLQRHQIFGIVFTLIAVISLSYIAG